MSSFCSFCFFSDIISSFDCIGYDPAMKAFSRRLTEYGHDRNPAKGEPKHWFGNYDKTILSATSKMPSLVTFGTGDPYQKRQTLERSIFAGPPMFISGICKYTPNMQQKTQNKLTLNIAIQLSDILKLNISLVKFLFIFII